MLLVAIVAVAAILIQTIGLTAAIVLILRESERADAAGRLERRQLADRIQAPERIPLSVVPDFVLPEPEDDEINMVGSIADAPRDSEQ